MNNYINAEDILKQIRELPLQEQARLKDMLDSEKEDKKGLETNNPLYYNTQGDKGNTIFMVLNSIYDITFIKHWKMSFELAYYLRNTHYSYYKDVHTKNVETRLGITYAF